MPYTLVRLTVQDYAKWRPVFDEAATLRKAYGSKGVRVYRGVDKPNEIVVVAEYEDLAKARQLLPCDTQPAQSPRSLGLCSSLSGRSCTHSAPIRTTLAPPSPNMRPTARGWPAT